MDVVAGFLLKRKQHGGEAMKRDASAVRLLNRGICCESTAVHLGCAGTFILSNAYALTSPVVPFMD